MSVTEGSASMFNPLFEGEVPYERFKQEAGTKDSHFLNLYNGEAIPSGLNETMQWKRNYSSELLPDLWEGSTTDTLNSLRRFSVFSNEWSPQHGSPRGSLASMSPVFSPSLSTSVDSNYIMPNRLADFGLQHKEANFGTAFPANNNNYNSVLPGMGPTTEDTAAMLEETAERLFVSCLPQDDFRPGRCRFLIPGEKVSEAIDTPRNPVMQRASEPFAPQFAVAHFEKDNSRRSSPLEKKNPSVNTNLYKTEMCASYSNTGSCPYGSKCQFAHGQNELKPVERPPNWRSKPCINWIKNRSCRYGQRCCFRHDV